jgi:hypothetical protein
MSEEPYTEPDHLGNYLVLCIACGQHVLITTHKGETKWRYAEHSLPSTGERCDNSDQLVDSGGKS